MKYKSAFIIIFLGLILHAAESRCQAFRHPGIDLTLADLAFIKAQVKEWNQPWKDSFEKLKAGTDLNSDVSPVAHVLRGPYGKPDIGAAGLRKNAGLAYDCALLWYLSGEKQYARKAIEILNGWSATLSSFDLNDAKLLAGWTGHLFCNAAELLRFSNSGWQQNDIDRFTGMLMKVYYPVLRNYYPTANGNWDAAIIHSLMAIAVFTDSPAMFNNAVGHYLHGPVNGSLFKYIYPNGQCQESTRDQGHVQLGLTEYSGAARIAFSQGIDLFAAGDNRLALGFEYTSRVLLGERPFSYGVISERSLEPAGDYEHVYRHYKSAGTEMKYTGIIADSLRSRSPRTVLIASRAPSANSASTASQAKPVSIAYPAGA
ncbi:MAG: alginate lyase family protein, partial [Bacteroidales bacterium]|nr:alginate lyase family protein [Bacteroidales bacterium]